MVRGTKIFHDGSIYEGEFQDFKMHGGGSITYPNGTIYVGTFEQGHKHGLGNLFDP